MPSLGREPVAGAGSASPEGLGEVAAGARQHALPVERREVEEARVARRGHQARGKRKVHEDSAEGRRRSSSRRTAACREPQQVQRATRSRRAGCAAHAAGTSDAARAAHPPGLAKPLDAVSGQHRQRQAEQNAEARRHAQAAERQHVVAQRREHDPVRAERSVEDDERGQHVSGAPRVQPRPRAEQRQREDPEPGEEAQLRQARTIQPSAVQPGFGRAPRGSCPAWRCRAALPSRAVHRAGHGSGSTGWPRAARGRRPRSPPAATA